VVEVVDENSIDRTAADVAFAQRVLGADALSTLPHVPAPSPGALADAERALSGQFLIIGEQYDLGRNFSWQANPSGDKEWQIAHHKHYTLPSLLHAARVTGDIRYVERFVELLTSWLDEMGTGFISVSDAQVEAKRLESWLAARRLLVELPWEGLVPARLVRRWCERAGAEARYVLEHLKATRNHRTFQLASVFAVAVAQPWEPDALELRDRAAALLSENLLQDIRPDGVHVEGSTHYHQLVCEAALTFLELARAASVALDPAVAERVHRAARWTAWIQWPGRGIPLLNDADDGDQADLLQRAADLFDDEELRYAATRGAHGRPPAERVQDFEKGGMLVLTDGWGVDEETFARRSHVVVDAGVIGEGSHSHYDQLAVTMWAAGGPLVLDPGRYTYSDQVGSDGVNWRHHFKSTAAHNTVQIDGLDQTRYVSRTKHGPDALVVDRSVGAGAHGAHLHGSVASPEYAPRHARIVGFVAWEYLVVADVVDLVDGSDHRVDLRWHLPSDADEAVQRLDPAAVRVRTARGDLIVIAPGAEHALDVGWVSSHYGVKQQAPIVRSTFTGRRRPVMISVLGPAFVGTERLTVELNSFVPGEVWTLEVGVRRAGAAHVDVIEWAPGRPAAIGVARDGRRLDLG
jgi:Heparinase II/III-like protein/Heparinase II/III N-terminus